MKKYVVAILIVAASFIFKAQSNTDEILCENECADISAEVDKMVSQRNYGVSSDSIFMQFEPFSQNDLFIQFDSNVAVNSTTYRDYLSQKDNSVTQKGISGVGSRDVLKAPDELIPTPVDSALSCEYDRDYDYDCDAWGDYSGAYKSYIMAVQNQVYYFE